jgi:hypothetical protein
LLCSNLNDLSELFPFWALLYRVLEIINVAVFESFCDFLESFKSTENSHLIRKKQQVHEWTFKRESPRGLVAKHIPVTDESRVQFSARACYIAEAI